jgi:hypothetical protein
VVAEQVRLTEEEQAAIGRALDTWQWSVSEVERQAVFEVIERIIAARLEAMLPF